MARDILLSTKVIEVEFQNFNNILNNVANVRDVAFLVAKQFLSLLFLRRYQAFIFFTLPVLIDLRHMQRFGTKE